MASTPHESVTQLRLVVTVDDYQQAVRFYRDVLGLREQASFSAEGGYVTILEAGSATLELTDRRHAEYIDRVEVGRRVAPKYRVAFQVADSATATERLVDGGAELIAAPVRTPWDSLNSRLSAPGDLQLTLFTELDLRNPA